MPDQWVYNKTKDYVTRYKYVVLCEMFLRVAQKITCTTSYLRNEEQCYFIVEAPEHKSLQDGNTKKSYFIGRGYVSLVISYRPGLQPASLLC